MACCFSERSVEPSLLEQSANFFEGAFDAGGIARELHRRGVRQPFALAANQTLDQAHQRRSDASNGQKNKSNGRKRRSNGGRVLVENGVACQRLGACSSQQHTT